MVAGSSFVALLLLHDALFYRWRPTSSMRAWLFENVESAYHTRGEGEEER